MAWKWRPQFWASNSNMPTTTCKYTNLPFFNFLSNWVKVKKNTTFENGQHPLRWGSHDWPHMQFSHEQIKTPNQLLSLSKWRFNNLHGIGWNLLPIFFLTQTFYMHLKKKKKPKLTLLKIKIKKKEKERIFINHRASGMTRCTVLTTLITRRLHFLKRNEIRTVGIKSSRASRLWSKD